MSIAGSDIFSVENTRIFALFLFSSPMMVNYVFLLSTNNANNANHYFQLSTLSGYRSEFSLQVSISENLHYLRSNSFKKSLFFLHVHFEVSVFFGKAQILMSLFVAPFWDVLFCSFIGREDFHNITGFDGADCFFGFQ